MRDDERLPRELVEAVAKAYGVAPATARAALDEDERVLYDARRRRARLRARAAELRVWLGSLGGDPAE